MALLSPRSHSYLTSISQAAFPIILPAWHFQIRILHSRFWLNWSLGWGRHSPVYLLVACLYQRHVIKVLEKDEIVHCS